MTMENVLLVMESIMLTSKGFAEKWRIHVFSGKLMVFVLIVRMDGERT